MDRMNRVAKLIMMEISVLLQKEVNDPRVSAITITDIEITRDMRLAKIYYVPAVSDANEKKEVSRGLRSASRFLRGELARRMSMKYTPKLSFREDITEEKQRTVDELFERIEKEPGFSGGEEQKGAQDEDR
ncbi:MAG: 30S ribosome-binding factor RbfA [Candidatus Omnitrophica bacterium]|nr:30S ribosome-binding factor RbfA [Candidatus Omnitrophota bacterium]